MDYNTIAIIVSVVAVGIGLATLIVPSLRDLRRDVDGLRERIARLEGLFGGGCTPREPRTGGDAVSP